jgi:hypothetical protein
MTTAATIAEAITRSISHTEIVEVAHHDFRSAFYEIAAEADEYDYTNEGPGRYDVWGTKGGKEFRLSLVNA